MNLRALGPSEGSAQNQGIDAFVKNGRLLALKSDGLLANLGFPKVPDTQSLRFLAPRTVCTLNGFGTIPKSSRTVEYHGPWL